MEFPECRRSNDLACRNCCNSCLVLLTGEAHCAGLALFFVLLQSNFNGMQTFPQMLMLSSGRYIINPACI